MTLAAAPPWRHAVALAALHGARLAACAPTSAVGSAGSQGHSEAPFKLLSTTPGSGNGADDGKVTATPWDIVVLTLGCSVALVCCVLGVRRLMLQSAKEAAALEAALAALGADRDAGADAAERGARGGSAEAGAQRGRGGFSRDRRAPRDVPVALPAGDRQLPQLPSRGRRGAAAAAAAAGRIPAWRDDEDAALAASEAADVELVPMYTFTPESRADGEWFVAPLEHLPDEARQAAHEARRQRRRREREPPPQPEPQKGGVWGFPSGWG